MVEGSGDRASERSDTSEDETRGKSKGRLPSRRSLPRLVRENSTTGADSAIGNEAVVPLGAGPRSKRDSSVRVED